MSGQNVRIAVDSCRSKSASRGLSRGDGRRVTPVGGASNTAAAWHLGYVMAMRRASSRLSRTQKLCQTRVERAWDALAGRCSGVVPILRSNLSKNEGCTSKTTFQACVKRAPVEPSVQKPSIKGVSATRAVHDINQRCLAEKR
jgi:hypothetical protein